MTAWRRGVAPMALAMTFLAAASGTLAGCHEARSVSPDRISAVSINGHTWKVELALTAEQQYRGLSGRHSLAPDAGMLFVFPEPIVADFCMRDCHIPLDVAFIDGASRVVRTCTMQVEGDRVGRIAYSSGKPVKYVLETAAGSLGQAGVKPGDVVMLLTEAPEKRRP
ncbi:MAG: DUF192 domain-containing protein [Phycisphaerae bacterium]|jgi:hypothetical protein